MSVRKSRLVTTYILASTLSGVSYGALVLDGNISGNPHNDSKTCVTHTPDYHCDSTLFPDPVTFLNAPSSWFRGVVESEYGTGWTFNYLGGNDNLKGKLYVNYYKAYNRCPKLGAEIDVDLLPDPDSPIKDVQWLQCVSAKWSDGSFYNFVDDSTPPSGYVSPPPGSMWGPFYPYQDEDTNPPLWQSSSQNDDFYDKPSSPCPTPHTTEMFRAECYASWCDDFLDAAGNWVDVGNNGRNVYVHEGFRWGFNLTCVPEPTAMLALAVPLLTSRRRAVA